MAITIIGSGKFRKGLQVQMILYSYSWELNEWMAYKEISIVMRVFADLSIREWNDHYLDHYLYARCKKYVHQVAVDTQN